MCLEYACRVSVPLFVELTCIASVGILRIIFRQRDTIFANNLSVEHVNVVNCHLSHPKLLEKCPICRVFFKTMAVLQYCSSINVSFEQTIHNAVIQHTMAFAFDWLQLMKVY